MSDRSDTQVAATPDFIRQLTDAQFALFSYILLLVGDSTDARDVLQDTNLILIRDASHFDPASSFLAWAKTVAHYQVLTYRRKKHRDHLVFNDEVFQHMSERLAERSEPADGRIDAVSRCMRKLTESQRALIHAKYFERLSIEGLAFRFTCSSSAIVSLLYRIRKVLALCVESALKEDQ